MDVTIILTLDLKHNRLIDKLEIKGTKKNLSIITKVQSVNYNFLTFSTIHGILMGM